MSMAIFMNLHDSCDVAALVGVVGCRPDGDEDVFLREGVLVSFKDELVSTCYEGEFVEGAELSEE